VTPKHPPRPPMDLAKYTSRGCADHLRIDRRRHTYGASWRSEVHRLYLLIRQMGPDGRDSLPDWSNHHRGDLMKMSAEEVDVIRAFGEVMIVLAIVLALMLIEV
jgi:hypothetical protein